MDLAKIIGNLRVELQYLDAAIASMEQLARAQGYPDSSSRSEAPSDPQPPGEDAPPLKRRRGRPRKNPLPATEEAPRAESSGPAASDETPHISEPEA